VIDYLVKIGKETPLTKPTYWRNLTLSVGENYWLFQNWLRSLDWLKLTSRCLRLLREWTANSNNWARKTGQGNIWIFVFCEEILKVYKRPLFRQASRIGLFTLSSKSHASPPVLISTGDDPDKLPTVQEEMSPHSDSRFFIISCFV